MGSGDHAHGRWACGRLTDSTVQAGCNGPLDPIAAQTPGAAGSSAPPTSTTAASASITTAAAANAPAATAPLAEFALEPFATGGATFPAAGSDPFATVASAFATAGGSTTGSSAALARASRERGERLERKRRGLLPDDLRSRDRSRRLGLRRRGRPLRRSRRFGAGPAVTACRQLASRTGRQARQTAVQADGPGDHDLRVATPARVHPHGQAAGPHRPEPQQPARRQLSTGRPERPRVRRSMTTKRRGRTMRKQLTLALTALLTLLLLTPPAQAGTYTVYSCRTPSGRWVGSEGWSRADDAPCSTGYRRRELHQLRHLPGSR